MIPYMNIEVRIKRILLLLRVKDSHTSDNSTMNKIMKQLETLSIGNNLNASFFYPVVPQGDTDIAVASVFQQIEENFTIDIGEYPRKENLISDVKKFLFGEASNLHLASLNEFRKEITEILLAGLKKTGSLLNSGKDVDVFIFPLQNMRFSKMLDGISAFALGTHSLYFFIDTKHPQWRKSLTYITPHEYGHLVSFRYFSRDTILDAMVFEGLAEHLRENLYGGDKAKYSTALSKEDALKELASLPVEVTDLIITEENYDIHLSYFFGTKSIENWYGYSVGYWLIDAVLTNKEIAVVDLFKTKPKEILKIFLLSL
jgi:hypothetical protein